MHEVILVVDDEDSVRIMFARLLRMQGYQVVQAASASQALALLAEEEPDLVITDVVMPGESGIELRRAIAKWWANLPVIVASGYSAEGPAEFAARTPNTWFVQKPFVSDQFLSLVALALTDRGGPQSADSPAEIGFNRVDSLATKVTDHDVAADVGPL